MKFEEPNLDKRVALIGRRLGAFYFYALLKTIEEKDLAWLQETRIIFNYDFFLEAALELYSTGDKVRLEKIEDNLLCEILEIYSPEEGSVERLRNILKQIYPEEFSAFEKTLSNK
ncbi:MAG: hypothetical protein ABSA75_03395 [Candidatus Bathyarchaeia archaeon]|jgi:hypothetical protein